MHGVIQVDKNGKKNIITAFKFPFDWFFPSAS